MSKCTACEKQLTGDEIGATMKLINRGATEFYCVECLAKRFRITTDDVRALIERFKKAGCHLFQED